jgi:hypothetical protein
MQLSVTVTSLGGALVIQDPHPVRGLFSKTVPAGSALTFTCPWDIWHRINAQVEAYRVAGLCTVALSEVTPTGTDSTSGLNTTYNKADWAHLNSFRKDIDALQTTVGTVTAPTLNKGSIAANTDFPLLADVEEGWAYTITADVTDDAGVTYTNTGLVFTVNEEIVWNGTSWIRLGKELTGPYQYKGNIAIAADFPLPAATASTGVRDGFTYRVTAPVVDNDATKTNTSQEFLLGDIIVWLTSSWYVIGNSNQLVDVGAITLAADFPTTTAVKRGYCYRILADVIDNDGTKTNTTQQFLAGDHIMWDGVAAWVALGKESAFQVAVATPIVLPASSSVNYVDTTTIAAPSAAALPAATAVMTGRVVSILDTAIAGTHNIVITPDGTDTIDGVNAPITLITNLEYVTLQCIGLGAWKVVASNARVRAGVYDGLMTATQATTLAGIADDHVHMVAANVDMKTDESEISAALNGDPTKMFLATHIFIKSVVNVGALNADGTLNVGISADGAQLLAAQALTGIGAVDTCRMIPLAEHGVTVAGNATLYVNVEAADTGAGTLNIDVVVLGRQL